MYLSILGFVFSIFWTQIAMYYKIWARPWDRPWARPWDRPWAGVSQHLLAFVYVNR